MDSGDVLAYSGEISGEAAATADSSEDKETTTNTEGSKQLT